MISGSYLQKQSFHQFFLKDNQRTFLLSLGYLWLVEDLYTREKLIETKVLM